jgi:ATP-binding cassette subfamily F protein 3
VALAKLTLTGANFLILDEPTNHLDIPAQETLESGLRRFTGTILLTSHDRYFIDAVATHVWALEPETQGVTVVEGGYSLYLGLREVPGNLALSNGSDPEAKSDSQRQREQTKAEKREADKKAKQVAEIEDLISATETKLNHLAQQLEAASYDSSSGNVSKLQRLSQEYQDTAAKLEDLLNKWTTLEAV